MLAQAGLLEGRADGDARPMVATEDAIRNDDALTVEQKQALLAVYRSYVDANR